MYIIFQATIVAPMRWAHMMCYIVINHDIDPISQWEFQDPKMAVQYRTT